MIAFYYINSEKSYHFILSLVHECTVFAHNEAAKQLLIWAGQGSLCHMDKSEVVGLSGLSEYQSRQLEKILRLLNGVDLSKDKIRALIWLAGWEESTVDSLLSVMDKVAKDREYQGGREE